MQWYERGDPCGLRAGREYDLVDATASGATVAVLCGSHVGPDREFVIVSNDSGHDFGSPDWLHGSRFGHLAAVSGQALIAASGGISGDGRASYQIVSSTEPGAAWRQALAANEPVYDQPEELAGLSALELSANAVTYIADGVHVWRSDNAGRSWHRLTLP